MAIEKYSSSTYIASVPAINMVSSLMVRPLNRALRADSLFQESRATAIKQFYNLYIYT